MADGGDAPLVILVPLAQIRRDPHQPRRTSEGEVFPVGDLLPQIREQGIVTPLDVGPLVSGEYPLRDGERRLLCAEQLCLKVVPVLVGPDLSPDDVLARQLATYARQPLPPLAEAGAIKRLAEMLHVRTDLAIVADRLGVSVRHIRQRLVLLTLVAAAQELLAASPPRITLGLALLLATLAEDGQRRAVQSIAALPPGPEPIGIRDGGGFVRAQRLSLAAVPWDLADAKLDKAAGACSACPKRTSAQAALFADPVEKGDECTDRACFERKSSAWRAKRDDDQAERNVGPEAAAKGREAKADAFQPPAKRHLPIANDLDEDDGHDLGHTEGLDDQLPKVSPKGKNGGERAAADTKARNAEIARTLTRVSERVSSAGLDTPTLLGLVIRVVSGDALLHVAGHRALDTPSPRAALLKYVACFVEDGDLDPLDGLMAELLAAHDADAPTEDGAYNLALRWLGPEKPAPAVTRGPVDIACSRKGCKVVAGKACKGTALGKHHPERVAAWGDAEAAKEKVVCATCGQTEDGYYPKGSKLLAPRPHHKGANKSWCKGTVAASPATSPLTPREEAVLEADAGPCPITWADVERIAKGLKFKPHSGANSPGNVWGVVKRIRASGKAEETRDALRVAHASSGACVDIAMVWLVEREGFSIRIGAAKHNDVLVHPAALSPEPPPPPACAICKCTVGACCTDDHPASEEGECDFDLATGICSVCARCTAAALKLCQAKRAPTTLEKALTTGGKDVESFDKPRAKAAIAWLEAKGQLGRAGDGKLLAAQAARDGEADGGA